MKAGLSETGDEAGQALWPWLSAYPSAVRWDAAIPARPVFKILDETCRHYGDRSAFDFYGKKWRWAEIGTLVNRLAKGLQGQGVKKGVKVGLFLPNCPYYLIAYYAVMKAGGTVVNFNPLYAPRELAHQIEDSETEIMVTLDLAALYDKIKPLIGDTCLKKIVACPFAESLPFPKNILFRLFKGKEIADLARAQDCLFLKNLLDNDGKPDIPAIDAQNDVALLQYTGGTTGTPKGAMLTHANVAANVEQAVMWFSKAQPGQEKMLGVLPFFHVFAMTAVMNMAVRCAFEIIAVPRFDLRQVLKIIDRKKPHYFPAVPSIYNAINHEPSRARYDLSSLRYCISGGAPLPVETKRLFEENTGCIVVEGYGLSESSPVVCVNPVEGLNKPGSIGLPVPGTIVELIDPETGAPVPPGKPGELCVRGPQVMKGYYNKPEETAQVLKNGRLHTGDVAYADEQGYFFIIDRIKDMIITNGYNVYPRNVEEAIYLHPAVEECIVAGVPDESRGEIVKAWIKKRQGQSLSDSDIKDFLADKLSKIEIPRLIEIRDTPLPKTMIGKLSRKEILAQEAEKQKIL